VADTYMNEITSKSSPTLGRVVS